MKKIHYTLISGIAVIFAISGLGFSSLTDEIPQEPVTTSPEPSSYMHNLKNDYGNSVAEETVATRTNLDVAKFDDMSAAKMGEKQLSLLDVRMRDNGYVHYIYGESTLELTDATTTDKFHEMGGIVVRTIPLKDQENTNDALANFLKDEVTYVNGVAAIVKGNDEIGYRIDLYPGDNRKISIGALATLDDLTQFVADLGIENKGLNLNDYVKENWKLPVEPAINSKETIAEP